MPIDKNGKNIRGVVEYRPFWSAFMGMFAPPEGSFITNADEELIEQTNRMLTKLASQKDLDDKSKKLLK